MNNARFGATASIAHHRTQCGQNSFRRRLFGSTVRAAGSTELYDPVTNTFASAMDQTASMNTARYLATATMITNGLAGR